MKGTLIVQKAKRLLKNGTDIGGPVEGKTWGFRVFDISPLRKKVCSETETVAGISKLKVNNKTTFR